MDKFDQNIRVLRSGVRELLDRNDSTTPQENLLTESLEHLHVALEEMEVAESELRQQNEELAIARAAVEAERQRYQDLFEFAPDGYMVTDANGTIREANRAAAMLLNVSQRFLVGKPLVIFIAESERHAFRTNLSQLHQMDGVGEREVSLQPRKKVSFDAALTVSVVRDREGKPVALRWLLRDITSRKRVEEALLRAKVAEAARVELEKEITSRQRAEKQLMHNAFHDALTGLPNRAFFMDRLERVVAYGKRHEDYLFAVLFLDLDRFKVINDSLGHLFGDQLLLGIARRLKTCLRPTDTVARLGGDEFTILLEDIEDVSDAIRVADRLQAELTLPFDLDGQSVFTSASIGIALSVTGYNQPEELLRDADIAMYRAKALGKARYEIFNTEMHARAVARLQLETDLRLAVQRQEFRLQYQPIVSLETGIITGFEALVRWQHPQHGLIYPDEFIPVAEEAGLIIPIDRWVLREACRQTRIWQEQFPKNLPFTISVNLCRNQFAQSDLIKHIHQILEETDLDASSLRLEITEKVLMENGDSAIAILSQLRNIGIKLYIDDFGTGYSSLGRLHHFPINVLKIDRSFVSRIGVAQGNLEIAETIVTLAQKLGVDVIAEGVETVEQLVQLRRLKCEYGQGHFFSGPLDSPTAEALIMASPQW